MPRIRVRWKIKKKINIPNSIAYRLDIGCKVQEKLEELQDSGYAMDVESGKDC
mgnify:CR=1 FL=1